ncbi:MAG: hypothetical protein AAF497_23145 [Planctomycetota bacterium]
MVNRLLSRSKSSILLALLTLSLVGQQAVAQPTIATRDNVFYVPFTQPDMSGPPHLRPKVIELFVSGNHGRDWSLYQQRSPDENRFTFRAGVDGEYWFAVRTLDQSGKPSVQRISNPEMIVIVDRREPKLSVAAQVAPDREVHTQFTATDPEITRESLEIEYRTQADETWKKVAVQSQSLMVRGENLLGRANWIPPESAETVVMRVTAKDKAGNSAVVERRLELPPIVRIDEQVASIPLPDDLQEQVPVPTVGPLPDGPPPTNWEPQPSNQSPLAPTNPTRQPFASEPETSQWFGDTAGYQPEPPKTESSNVGPATEKPLAIAPNGPGPVEVQPQPPVASQSANAATDAYPPISDFAPLATPNNNATAETEASLPNRETPPPMQQQVTPPIQPTNGPAIPPASQRLNSPTMPENVLISKSRKFNLDYYVEAKPEDVYRVEVWYTADNGRTWRHEGDDPDRKSPYLLNVNNDGMYGFRLIVQAQEGLVARPPQSGDPADIWILVDSVEPVVQISSATFGRGTNQGLLQIMWDARDADLSDNPITLLYSSRPEGPWRKLASELPNTGRYDWRADDRTPANVFLQIEATDRAGNVGRHTLTTPIKSEGLAPRGHIREIRPAAKPVETQQL